MKRAEPKEGGWAPTQTKKPLQSQQYSELAQAIFFLRLEKNNATCDKR
jgi:hypothetical protein